MHARPDTTDRSRRPMTRRGFSLLELTLVIAGAPEPDAPALDAVTVAEEVAALVADGRSTRDAVAQVASAHGLRRRDVYATVLAARDGATDARRTDERQDPGESRG